MKAELVQTTSFDLNSIDIADTDVYEPSAPEIPPGFSARIVSFKDLLKKLKPDCFEDIVAAVALYRPDLWAAVWWMTVNESTAN